MATERRCALVLELFETCFERVYRFARRSADPEAAEEVAQEVFARLLCVEDLETKTINASYLIKIADNLLKRRHQRVQRWRRVECELSSGIDRRPGAMAARPHEHADEARVAAAMDRLSDEERDTLRLIICDGLSYDDAARALGVQVSTINNWKHRGIQKLKKHVGHERGPEDADREPRGRVRQAAGARKPPGRDA